MVFCLSVYAKKPSAVAKRVNLTTQEEIKALSTTGEDRYAAWITEHAKAGGNKRAHTNLTICAKRRTLEEALALITLTSTEKNIYSDAPDIDVYIKPVEIGVNASGEMTKKEAGATTQLRSGKNSPAQTGISGKQAELAVGLQVAANANALEVTTKVIGKNSNQSYESIVSLSYETSSASVGGSSSSETSFFKQSSNQRNNALTFLGYAPPTNNFLASLQGQCRIITVSCSCSGCPGCSTSKSCKDNCYPIISSCNPINGTCSLSCCQC
jgi:hypothetical protein